MRPQPAAVDRSLDGFRLRFEILRPLPKLLPGQLAPLAADVALHDHLERRAQFSDDPATGRAGAPHEASSAAAFNWPLSAQPGRHDACRRRTGFHPFEPFPAGIANGRCGALITLPAIDDRPAVVGFASGPLPLMSVPRTFLGQALDAVGWRQAGRAAQNGGGPTISQPCRRRISLASAPLGSSCSECLSRSSKNPPAFAGV